MTEWNRSVFPTLDIFSGHFCFAAGGKGLSDRGHSYGAVEGLQGLIGKRLMLWGNLEEHRHTPTLTHTSFPEGRKVSIQRRKWWAIVMIDHMARSREDAVSLSLSNSLYHRRRFPSPALMSFLLSSHVREIPSLHAGMSWACRGGKPSEICWTHTMF